MIDLAHVQWNAVLTLLLAVVALAWWFARRHAATAVRDERIEKLERRFDELLTGYGVLSGREAKTHDDVTQAHTKIRELQKSVRAHRRLTGHPDLGETLP